jgi:hypothetical protein
MDAESWRAGGLTQTCERHRLNALPRLIARTFSELEYSPAGGDFDTPPESGFKATHTSSASAPKRVRSRPPAKKRFFSR